MKKKELNSTKKSGVKTTMDSQRGMVFIPKDEKGLKKLEPDFDLFDAPWCQVKYIEEELLHQHLVPFIRRILSKEAFLEARLGFFPDVEYIQALDKALQGPFLFWVLFDWRQRPLGLSRLFNKPVLVDRPLAIKYGNIYSYRLNQAQQKWIQAMSETYYSFYVVMALLPQQEIKLKDIFLNTESVVKDCHARAFLKAGDIIWCRILTWGGNCCVWG